jgi:UDP-glucuronate 4-epimerase
MLMKTVFLTGAAGFIGSHTAEKLLSLGYAVIGVDNFDGLLYDPSIKRKNIVLLKNKNFTFYEIDIADKAELDKVFKRHKFDFVVHLAARAGVLPSLKFPQLYAEANITGTINVLEACKDAGIKRVVFASSSSVYGSNKKLPFSEEDRTDTQISPYAATKKAGESICHSYSHIYGMSIACLRFFTVYGPRGRPDMVIYKFTKNIFEGKPITVFGEGTKRDYTYIADIVDGVIAAMEKNKGYNIYNLGNSDTVEMTKLLSLMEKYIGKKAIIRKAPLPTGDVPATYADIAKAKKILGFNPKTKIETGLKNFVDWYKKEFNEDI